jgi:hypothetical protein
MKNILTDNVYRLFLLTGFVSLCIALVFKGVYPTSFLDVSIYGVDINIASSQIWFLFTGYLFLLTSIYFVISKAKLKTKKWLVISHYSFIVLFLVFFAIFSSLSSWGAQRLLDEIPLITLITIYGILFLIDVIFFALGILFLFVNIFSLSKNKVK